jgi:hypothetical protein
VSSAKSGKQGEENSGRKPGSRYEITAVSRIVSSRLIMPFLPPKRRTYFATPTYPGSGGGAMGLYRKEGAASRYFAHALRGLSSKKNRFEKSTGQGGGGSGKK